MGRTKIELVEEFQCPGCVGGPDPAGCSAFDEGEFGCTAHVPGTMMLGGNGVMKIALGLPKGFDRYPQFERGAHVQSEIIRLHPEPPEDFWNELNVPVWAMELDGVLFVRTYGPRVNRLWIDVIPGGKRTELCPQAIDVAEFYDQID